MAEHQDYGNHKKTPTTLIAYSVLGILATLLAAAALYAALAGSGNAPVLLSAAVLLLSLAAVGGMIMARQYSLVLQDRIIRLEMQVRLARVLPAELQAETGRLTMRQLIALRFASDAELSTLVEATLRENNATGDWIKKQIRQWQADHQRV